MDLSSTAPMRETPTRNFPTINKPAAAFLDRQNALVAAIRMLAITVVIAVVACIGLGGYCIGVAKQTSMRTPFVVGVDSIGHAEALAVSHGNNRVKETEARYFIRHFITDYLERRHESLSLQRTNVIHFFSEETMRRLHDDDLRTKWIEDFIANPQAEEVHIKIVNDVPYLDQRPYRARVEFEKHFVVAGNETRPFERWTADMTFYTIDKVPVEYVDYNPLGIVQAAEPRFIQEQ